MIDKATAEQIKNRADIVEVVSDYVALTRRGANYMGLCPFHNERTPSFSVNKARNFCYCFSCHKGGSPVNFIMEKEGIGYQDALRQLARKYGIRIEERELSDAERQAQSERESLFMANEWAMERMQRWLVESEEGRNVGLAYLYGRGITPDAVKHFKLGYSPDRNALEEAARHDGYSPETLYKLGLLGRNAQGRYYDRFRGRVIYPVLNTAGKVVAFGGRDLKGAPAKYINSPESPIYKKSNELYGLHQARGAMVKEDSALLVEGYMDVIGLWQAGIGNVIASSGTALTDGQIALVHRFTHKVTLIYDGDDAGVKASMRGIDMLLSHNLDIKVLLLPDGHDPDSFARANTPARTREYIQQHQTDFITFKTQVLMREGGAGPQARTEAARSIVESLAHISDKMTRTVYIGECARMLGIDEKILSFETDKMRRRVVEQLRKERGYKEIDQSASPSGNTAASSEVSSEISSMVTSSSEVAEVCRHERRLMTYCARYGMTDFPVDEGTTVPLCVYISDELHADDITLADPVCRRMLELALHTVEKFQADREDNFRRLDAEKAEKFNAGVARLASGNLEINEIETREKQLDEVLDLQAAEADFDFCCNYLGEILLSHEEDDMRHLAGQMLAEPHTLSKYHSKTGTIIPERDRLAELVPRAINELRAILLDINIDRLEKQLASAPDFQAQLEVMNKIHGLQEIRKQFAMSNGERIINPHPFR